MPFPLTDYQIISASSISDAAGELETSPQPPLQCFGEGEQEDLREQNRFASSIL